MDTNRDGTIDREEALKAMLSMQLHVSKADLDEVMNHADTDGDGHISFDEFENGIMSLQPRAEFTQGYNKPKYMMAGGVSVMHAKPKKGNEQATDEQIDEYMGALKKAIDTKYDMLYKAFAAIDGNNSAHLSFDELLKVCEHFKLPIPLTHVHEVFYQVFDRDGDGKVSYREFCDKLRQWDEA